MEHQKMAVESSNQVKKMEIDKQRDDLSKKTDQHARMKEAAKREHENQVAHQKLDNAKKNLEEETLKRIDLQNQLQSAQEAGKFEKQLQESLALVRIS